jgi:hypothetical protein
MMVSGLDEIEGSSADDAANANQQLDEQAQWVSFCLRFQSVDNLSCQSVIGN